MQKLKPRLRELYKGVLITLLVRMVFSVLRSIFSTPVFFYTRARTRVNLRKWCALLFGAILLIGIVINLASPIKTSAAVNNSVNFQARLENSSGAIVPDGTYNLEFKLYNVSSGGTALWTEDYLNSASQGAQV